jgi:hypothetical protein
MNAREKLRQRLSAVASLNKPAQRLTSLGMHYVPAPDGTPVLVLIEINVPRLLATVGQKVTRNKCGMSAGCKGSVRLSLATARDREICGGSR